MSVRIAKVIRNIEIEETDAILAKKARGMTLSDVHKKRLLENRKSFSSFKDKSFKISLIKKPPKKESTDE